MSESIDRGDPATLPPDEAFAVLGNETRIRILHVLADAPEPLSFSELYDRIDYDPSTNFSYHLKKLEGHFVRKTDEGYELGQVGNRVVQAVLSGTMTEAPLLERTRIDHRCEFCGADTEIGYTKGYLGLYCTECPGNTTDEVPEEFRGYLRAQPFPPAGLQSRTATEIHRAAFTWGNLQRLSLASDLCPICSARLDTTMDICETHDFDGDFCETCDRRRLVSITTRCTNCIIEGGGPLRTFLLADTEVLAFLTTHGINPLAASTEPWAKLETRNEEIVSTEPAVVRLTLVVDGDTIALTVDSDLSVIDVTRGEISTSG